MDIHNWVSFSNPRNRRVLIQGCLKCGALKNSFSNKKLCHEVSLKKNSLIKMGWTLADSEALANNTRRDNQVDGQSLMKAV